MNGFGGILRKSDTGGNEFSQGELSFGVALSGGLAEIFGGQVEVLFNAQALGIEDGQVVLRWTVALYRCLLKPLSAFFVAVVAFFGDELHAELELAGRVASLSAFEK